MRFILAPDSIKQFDHLRDDYERIKKINIEATPSRFGMPTFFGGTDIISRRAQIFFLEKIKAGLQKFLFDVKEIEPWQAHLMVARIMISACLFVQAGIGSSKENSVLYRLINQYLGISSDNFLDDEDKKKCFVTAWKLIQSPESLDMMNTYLRDFGLSFSDDEWENFGVFLNNAISTYRIKKIDNPCPVTSLTQPLFQDAFSYVGATTGWVVAEVFSSSVAVLPSRLQLTSLVGNTLLLVGPAGTVGLLAPTIAARLINSLCTVSLSTISGKTMGYVGYGAGTIVGYPFDAAWSLLKAAGSMLLTYTQKVPDAAALDGIRIADGIPIINGLPVKLQLVSEGEGQRRLTNGTAIPVLSEPEETSVSFSLKS